MKVRSAKSMDKEKEFKPQNVQTKEPDHIKKSEYPDEENIDFDTLKQEIHEMAVERHALKKKLNMEREQSRNYRVMAEERRKEIRRLKQRVEEIQNERDQWNQTYKTCFELLHHVTTELLKADSLAVGTDPAANEDEKGKTITNSTDGMKVYELSPEGREKLLRDIAADEKEKEQE